MKTIKEVSRIAGISIRTLRYYDEIGLLKPTALTDAKYRLYDEKALEKLQQIMFFRELEMPLDEIARILQDPDYNKEKTLQSQKKMLEKKRNRLNGIIELISDVMKGVNTMSFEAFNDDDISKIIDHTLSCMKQETLEQEIKKHGSLEQYKDFLKAGFSNEQAMSDLLHWYGSKEKAMEAVMNSTGNEEEAKEQTDENELIYQEFVKAKSEQNEQMCTDAIIRLSECYKKMFMLDNARNILIDLAKEYLSKMKLAEVTDEKYGEGISDYIGNAIMHYYGEI